MISEDTREVIIEWQVTTTMPRWIFDDAEADGRDIYNEIAGLTNDYDFTYRVKRDMFESIEATIIGVSFRE